VVVGVTVKIPLVFVAMAVPPQLLSYKLQLAPVPSEPPITVIVDALLEHKTAGVAASDMGSTETSSTVIVAGTQLVVLHNPEA